MPITRAEEIFPGALPQNVQCPPPYSLKLWQTICLANFINWGIDMKTDNYSLPQWEKQDFIKMEDFNDVFGKTDAALKAHDTAPGKRLPPQRWPPKRRTARPRSRHCKQRLSAAIGAGGKTCRTPPAPTPVREQAAANPVSITCPFALFWWLHKQMAQTARVLSSSAIRRS